MGREYKQKVTVKKGKRNCYLEDDVLHIRD